MNPMLIGNDANIIPAQGRVEAAKLFGRSRVPTLAIFHFSVIEQRTDIPSHAASLVSISTFVDNFSINGHQGLILLTV